MFISIVGKNINLLANRGFIFWSVIGGEIKFLWIMKIMTIN